MSAVFELMATLGIDTSAFESGLKKAQGFSQSVFGKGLAGAANIGVQAIKAAADATVSFAQSSIAAGQTFDASMSNVAAISGAAGSEFDALREKAMEMGAKTKFSATQAADAFSYMAMAGWKTEDMLGGIEGVMNLAAASGEDLATTSDIVTDALTAFGLSASDSSHFANVLAAASSNANTNVSMMGETFKYAAPLAGSFGFSVEDTALAIGLMANAGIKSSQAGTSLRTIMTTLAGPIHLAGEAFGEATVEVTNADGSMRGLGEVMQELRGYWMQMSEAEKVSSAEALVGKNAMSGFLAIMNAGEADIEKLTGAIEHCDDAMENASGAADEMAQRMGDNLAGDITYFNSALESAQIIVSDGLTPTLREFVQLGTKGLSDMTTAFRENGLEGVMQAFGETLEQGVGMILEKLPQVIEVARTILEALADAISANLPMIIDSAVEVVSFLLSGLIDALPILADGAIELVLALANGISAALPELIPAAVEAVLMIVNALLENIPLLVDAAGKLIIGLVEGLNNSLDPLGESGSEVIASLVAGIVGALPLLVPIAVELVLALADGIMGSIKLLVDIIPEVINAFKTAFTENADKFFEIGTQAMEGLGEGMASWIDSIVEKAKYIFSTIIDGIKEFLGIHSPSTVFAELGKQLLEGLILGIIETIPNLIVQLVENILSIGQAVVEGASKLLDFLKKGIETGLEKVTNIVPDFVKKIVEAFEAKADSFTSLGTAYLSSFADGLKQSIEGVLTAAKDLGLKVINAVKEALSINSPSAKMQEIGLNTGEGFLIGLQSKVEGIIASVQSMAQLIISIFSAKVGEFKNAGFNMMAGIGQGLESSFASVKKKLRSMVSNLVSLVRQILKISSPSKVMEEIGEYTGKGLEIGVTSSIADAQAPIENSVYRHIIAPLENLNSQTASLVGKLKDYYAQSAQATQETQSQQSSISYKNTGKTLQAKAYAADENTIAKMLSSGAIDWKDIYQRHVAGGAEDVDAYSWRDIPKLIAKEALGFFKTGNYELEDFRGFLEEGNLLTSKEATSVLGVIDGMLSQAILDERYMKSNTEAVSDLDDTIQDSSQSVNENYKKSSGSYRRAKQIDTSLLDSINSNYFLDRFEKIVGDLSPDKYTNIDRVLNDNILRDSIMIDKLVGEKFDTLAKNIQADQSKQQGVGDIIIPVYIGNESIETIVVNAMNRAAYRKGDMAYA